jgi:hypothetical protein
MTTKELELSLTPHQRTVLDYIMMEYLTVPESDSMTIEKLHSMMTFIVNEFHVFNWFSSVDNNYVYATKEFCKAFKDEILNIVNGTNQEYFVPDAELPY